MEIGCRRFEKQCFLENNLSFNFCKLDSSEKNGRLDTLKSNDRNVLLQLLRPCISHWKMCTWELFLSETWLLASERSLSVPWFERLPIGATNCADSFDRTNCLGENPFKLFCKIFQEMCVLIPFFKLDWKVLSLHGNHMKWQTHVKKY